jgi:cullin-associated NEDD8-dissociated protein 1
MQSLIVILKPLAGSSPDCLKYVEQICDVVISKLRLNDIDQEVKERAIGTTGILLSTFGANVTHHLNSILPILLDRVRNEMTRQITVQSFVVVAAGNQVNLAPIMNDLLTQLAEFLRKNQRALRVSTLTLLSTLVTKYSLSPVDGIDRVVREIPSVIVDQDMYISQLSLMFAGEVVNKYPQTIVSSLDSIIGSCVTLVKSSLLVGRLLDYAIELFVSIVKSSIAQKPKFTVCLYWDLLICFVLGFDV